MLGQHQVAGKSNEITAIPDLLDALTLKGSIVTLDAMGCQRKVVGKILARDADYLVTLKANQGRMFNAVKGHCEQTCLASGGTNTAHFDEFDDSRGRLVRRRVFVCPDAVTLEPLCDWPGLRAVLAFETIRSVNGSGATEAEIRYFLSSCPDELNVLVQANRRHWSIENSLHWVLDVTFREDECRMRDRIAVQNMALLRKIVLNLVRSDKSSRASLRGRRKAAGWNDDYMLQIITQNFDA